MASPIPGANDFLLFADPEEKSEGRMTEFSAAWGVI
jgi:hypothetical protein